jgi:DNA mismatch repair protein MutS
MAFFVGIVFVEIFFMMSMMEEKFTPAMQQYVDMKKQYSDCILFFRLGDFYETFFEDAKICAKVLDIVLTSKNRNADNPIPMAGIPYHSVDKYIARLIAHGYKIAIAEQMTEPVPGKIVERQVQSIITPATYIEEQNKDRRYIVSISYKLYKDGSQYHISWGDFTVGQYQTKSFIDSEDLILFVLALKPVEIVLDVDMPAKEDIQTRIQLYTKCLVSVYDVPYDAVNFVTRICQVQTIASFGQALEEGRLESFALLLHYLHYTQKNTKLQVARVGLYNHALYLKCDAVTIRNLEVFASSYESNVTHSLFGVLDNCATVAGSRLLRDILWHPLANLDHIQEHQRHVAYALEHRDDSAEIHRQLKQVGDIMKAVSTILYKKTLPVYFVKLRSVLSYFFWQNDAKGKVLMLDNLQKLGLQAADVDACRHVYNHLDQLLKDDEDVNNEYNFVRDGFAEDIDALKKIAFHSDELLLAYQQELVQHTGISSVKIIYIKNQGYFIEVTNKDIDKLEASSLKDDEKFDLMRRQTLKGSQRYVTPYLDVVQQSILEAKDQLIAKEFAQLEKTKELITTDHKALARFADAVAWLDVYTSHALFAYAHRYVQPTFVRDAWVSIVGARHPVIEKFLPIDQQFIPNDLTIGALYPSLRSGWQEGAGWQEKNNIHIITGPNMGGKSTYLRQNALIVLLAHCGLCVPASEVKLWVVDGIFARVGSGDVIAKNQSTFMTEMIEVANILHNASSKSFVIFDELGRGTSTYDGLALTQAILQYIAQEIQCQTLIATHYHELIQLEWQVAWVENYSVSVYETDKEVVFLKKIVKGWASKSYGLDVAKIAGIPQVVVQHAQQLLSQIENTKKEIAMTATPLLMQPMIQDNPKYEKIKKILGSYDINNLTPLQALQLLAKVKEEME